MFVTGYSSNQNVMHAGNDDSVLNLKRELRDHLTTSNRNTAEGEDGSTPTATTASTSEQVNDFVLFLRFHNILFNL